MTAQVPENLSYNGESVTMASTPTLPPFSLLRNPNEPPSNDLCLSTACWRGYIGSWEIREDRLYLIDIDGKYKLPHLGPIFAEWFSGIIKIPRGEELEYIHMGFGSVYEEEIRLTVNKGLVTSTEIIDNRSKEINEREISDMSLPDLKGDYLNIPEFLRRQKE